MVDVQRKGPDIMRNAFCGLMLLAACAVAQTVDGTGLNSVTQSGIPAVRVPLKPVSGQQSYARPGSFHHSPHGRLQMPLVVMAGSPLAL